MILTHKATQTVTRFLPLVETKVVEIMLYKDSLIIGKPKPFCAPSTQLILTHRARAKEKWCCSRSIPTKTATKFSPPVKTTVVETTVVEILLLEDSLFVSKPQTFCAPLAQLILTHRARAKDKWCCSRSSSHEDNHKIFPLKIWTSRAIHSILWGRF